MAGVVNGFRWALLGSGNGPDATLWVSVAISILHFVQRVVLFPKHGKDLCGYDLIMTTAISVKNLGKQYRIGTAQTKFKYGMFREVLVDAVKAPVRAYKALTGKVGRHKLTPLLSGH